MKTSLYSDLRKLRILFCKKDGVRIVVLFCIMLSGSFLEALSIGVIPGFVRFLMSPASLAKLSWLGDWTASLPEAPTPRLMLWASLGFIFVMTAKGLFLAFAYYTQNKMVNGFRVRLSCQMFEAYQSAPYEWLLQRSSSELQRNILNDVAQVVLGVIMPLLDLVMALTMTICIVIAMLLSTSPVILIGAALTGLGVLIVVPLFRKHLQQAGEVDRRESQSIIQSIQQGVGALVDARISGREAYLAEQFRRSTTEQARMATLRASIARLTPLAIEVVALIGLLIILLMITSDSSSIADALPTMSLLGIATIRLKQMATRVATQVNIVNTSRPSIPMLTSDVRILEAVQRQQTSRREPSLDQHLANFDKLTLEGVSYTYPNAETPAVCDVSLEIHRGESIGFVGETGCGKSTLVNLVLGLLEPQRGTVKVNGVDILSTLDSWRNHLSYIPQTIFLLDDTIRANVAFGLPYADVCENRLADALKSACLSDFVSTLPRGENTIVGERGVRLSGGQRQRIGIARALYSNPEVLVMDEATSSLDNKTEAEVMEAISNLKTSRTLIMVAHRLSTVEDCDRLYCLRDGNLCAQGSFGELQEHSVEVREISSIVGSK